MRIKVIAIATAIVAALAIGALSSNAALQQDMSANVKLSKGKAGNAATVSLNFVNEEDNGTVPQRISEVTLSSKIIKFNPKAAPYCNISIPKNPDPANDASSKTLNCPKKSKLTTGKFTAVTGTPGQAIPADVGVINGEVRVFNYKPSGGQQAALLLEIWSNVPVQNGHVYQLATVSKSGVLTTTVPRTTDLPPAIADILTGRQTVLTRFNLTLNGKARQGKKPYLTLKKGFEKSLDVRLQIKRDAG